MKDARPDQPKKINTTCFIMLSCMNVDTCAGESYTLTLEAASIQDAEPDCIAAQYHHVLHMLQEWLLIAMPITK